MKTFTVLAVALLLGAGPATAADTIRLTTEALTEKVVIDEKGRSETTLVTAARVAPGDEVIYAIHWENAGARPAEAVVITNPIPRHMVCLTAEEAASTRMTVSVDGGKTFAALAALTIANADGTTRPATWRDCTHVRWNFDKPLSPGQKGTFRFRAGLL
jgi:uncharacterized repeat protein (TIGR01451 family)